MVFYWHNEQGRRWPVVGIGRVVSIFKKSISNGRDGLDSAFTAALRRVSQLGAEPPAFLRYPTRHGATTDHSKEATRFVCRSLPLWLVIVADLCLKSCNYSIRAIRTAYSR